MCGIAGVWRKRNPIDANDLSDVISMMQALVHRGPDDHHSWNNSRLALGHRRLTIIDPSPAAREPMLTASGQGVLVYNGEVYNYRSLRETLQAQGIVFRTVCDAEVVLEALHHWGPEKAVPLFDALPDAALAELADLGELETALGHEVKSRGFKALKTNIMPYEDGKLVSFGPGFGRTAGHPALNADRKTLQAVRDTLAAFRSGAGPDMGLHLDVNYHFKTEGFLQVAKAVAPFDMTWLEIDTWDPQSLALIRRQAPCPIASLESVTGRRAFRPFFDAYAADVAITVLENSVLANTEVVRVVMNSSRCNDPREFD